MSVAKIQKGDQVKVISGSYRGTVGVVLRVVKKTLPNGRVRTRVSVSSIPEIVDYRKNFRAYNMPGQMKTKARLIDVSNVQLVTADGRVSRSRVVIQDGKKVRVLKKTGELVVRSDLSAAASEAPKSSTDQPSIAAQAGKKVKSGSKTKK